MLPNYIGPSAFGIKLPVIQPGDNIVDLVYSSLEKCARDGLLEDKSIVCITESVVARSQNNYVTLNDIAQEVKTKLNLEESSKIGVLFPIASRNRFSYILKGIARAVPKGEVWVQFPTWKDEVGNELINHPITKTNYLELYSEIIIEEGAIPLIIRDDQFWKMSYRKPDAIIVSSIHRRKEDFNTIKNDFQNCLTLQDLCNTPKEKRGWSEWGLLGSNLSSHERLKLAPRDGDLVALEVQKRVEGLGINVEVMIYGDGAYKDPSTGIYELADPVVSFGNTSRLEEPREGIKYKYLADNLLAQGIEREEVQRRIEEESKISHEDNSIAREGTTPRPLKDLAGSLADLVSGSADAGTPVIIIRGLLK